MKTIFAIILLVVYSSIVSAQAVSDSINIREIVQNQIKSAREVLEHEKFLLEKYKRENNLTTRSEQLNTRNVDADTPFISASTYLKIYILALGSILAFLIIVYRRKKQKADSGMIKKLKNNIKLLRKETPIQKHDLSLSKIRKTITKIELEQNEEDEIAEIARRHSLSKGEILLAAKIREKLFDKGKQTNINPATLSRTNNSENIIDEADRVLKGKEEKKEIIEKARELNVSREEVMLVSRLKKIISANVA